LSWMGTVRGDMSAGEMSWVGTEIVLDGNCPGGVCPRGNCPTHDMTN